MVKRSERIEALICEGRVSEEVLDSVCDEWMSAYIEPDQDAVDLPRDMFLAGVELGARAGSRCVTYADANGIVYFFLGTEEEALSRILAAEVMAS